MTEGKGQPICFIFNSPVLIPWEIVEPFQDKPEELTEAILSWDECKREGYRFKENHCVVDVNNPYQKMTIRRILRETIVDKINNEKKTRMIGIECYWWVEVTLETIMKLFNNGSFIKKSSDIYEIKK
jgi:hypothetical protein